MIDIGKLAEAFAGESAPVGSPAIRGVAEGDSIDGEVEVYLGELEQVYETELALLYETDEDGEIVYGIDEETGEEAPVPLLDEAGNEMYAEQVVRDENGEPVPVLDELGNAVYRKVQLVDADGDPIVEYDAEGNPVAATDAQGNPVYILDGDGQRIPEMDESGEIVYQRDPETGEYVLDGGGNMIPVYQVQAVEESQVAALEAIGSVSEGETPVVSMGHGSAAVIAGAGWGDSIRRIAGELSALIREYGDGVLVCREGNAVGALVNADGSFDVVSVVWDEDGIPEAGSPIASEGTDALKFYDGLGVLMKNIVAWYGKDFTRMGRVDEMHVTADDSGFEVSNGIDSFMKVDGVAAAPLFTVRDLDGNDYTYGNLSWMDDEGPMSPYRVYGSGNLATYSELAEVVANGNYANIHVQPGEPEWVYVDVPVGEPEPYLWIFTDGNIAGAWMRMEDVEATGSTAGALYNYVTGETTHGDNPDVGWGHQESDTFGSGVVPDGYTRSWFRLSSESTHYQWVICSAYRARTGSVTVGNTDGKCVVINDEGLSLRQFVVVDDEPSSYLDITALNTSGAVISAVKADPLILNPSILRLEADGTRLDICDELVEASGHIQDGYGNLLARKIDAADAVTGVKGAAEVDYRKGNVEIDEEDIGLGRLSETDIDAIIALAG